MNVKMLETSGQVACKLLTGSRAYGTHRPDSDYDYRGVFILPADARTTLQQVATEVGEDKPHDIKYYELAKFLRLARDCNPNIIELLALPHGCTLVTTPAWERIVESRHMFMSQRAYHTFSGYAYAQIKKMRGQNKFVHNPQPKERPEREDFCWVVPEYRMTSKSAPCRPVPYKELRTRASVDNEIYDLSVCKAAGLEHCKDVYRLYRDDEAVSKGVFRGGEVVCESISKEDERYFIGLLIYARDAYEKAVAQWKSYWDWVANRNPDRWLDQESGKTDYDCKNALHCVRLLMSVDKLLRTGVPTVQHTGADLQHLLDIRNGTVTYETLMAEVELRMSRLEDLKNNTRLPRGPDDAGIDKLFKELVTKKEGLCPAKDVRPAARRGKVTTRAAPSSTATGRHITTGAAPR